MHMRYQCSNPWNNAAYWRRIRQDPTFKERDKAGRRARYYRSRKTERQVQAFLRAQQDQRFEEHEGEFGGGL
ncbi:unnamed protein product [Allacma fusca]|uniref:Uncharacterized protein n=1 Tax=Allacma fusca TaxID=39272 RepID=A0A8J2K8Z4_9HEXA|nr:unnamed protein product [Allacma fusca]